MTDQHIAVQIQHAWHQLADLTRLAEYALTPRRGNGEPSRGKPQSKPPINLGASRLLADIDAEVGFYVHVLLDELDGYKPPRSLEARVRSVASHVGHFIGDEDRAGLDMLDCAQTLISRILAISMPPVPPSWSGLCESNGCEGSLWRGERAGVRCDLCGNVLDVDTWRQGVRRALDSRLVYRAEIRPVLRLLGMRFRDDAIAKWVQRGRIEPTILQPEMFRLSEVIDYAEGLSKKHRVSA